MERTVYNLLRTRDLLMRHCKEFKIPIEWMLDNGIIGKVHHTVHQFSHNVNDKFIKGNYGICHNNTMRS